MYNLKKKKKSTTKLVTYYLNQVNPNFSAEHSLFSLTSLEAWGHQMDISILSLWEW